MADSTTIKNIGCYFSKKKKVQLKWDRFVELAKNKNIVVHDIDFSNPVQTTVEIDLVITKFNTELVSENGPNPDNQCLQNLKNFRDYRQAHPHMIQLDPLEGQARLISRPQMLESFRNVAKKITNLYVPQSLVLETIELPNDFPFPAICKTLDATGPITSHDMSIIWDKQGLADLPRPLLVQQFINHDSTIFKVFTIADYWYMVKRPSIKNFHPDASNGNPVQFNSQQFKELQGVPTAPIPPQYIIDTLSKSLRDDLGLTLIGLDIITCSTTGKHYIIDANYFPGYTGVDDCPQKLLDLVLCKLNVT